MVGSSRGTEWEVAILLRCTDPEEIHIAASQVIGCANGQTPDRAHSSIMFSSWAASGPQKVDEGIRFESWSSKKYKATTTNKTANNAQATLFIVRENHISFSRPTAFQEARSLSRCTWTNWFCTQRAFRPRGKRSSPTHSGPRGKSELLVQRAD